MKMENDKKFIRGWGCSSMVAHLPNMRKALGSVYPESRDEPERNELRKARQSEMKGIVDEHI
jgi:hypothetical protein